MPYDDHRISAAMASESAGSIQTSGCPAREVEKMTAPPIMTAAVGKRVAQHVNEDRAHVHVVADAPEQQGNDAVHDDAGRRDHWHHDAGWTTVGSVKR